MREDAVFTALRLIKLNSDDAIYLNDLGPLGSAPMRIAEKDIFALIEKIKEGGEIFS